MNARVLARHGSQLFKSLAAVTAPSLRANHGSHQLLETVRSRQFGYPFNRSSFIESYSWNVGLESAATKGTDSSYRANDDGFYHPSATGAGAAREQHHEEDVKENHEKETGLNHEEDILEQKSQVLHAAMAHVKRLGWLEAALVAGARDAAVSPAVVGSFPRKDAALIEFFMDECNHQLHDEVEAREKELASMLLADRIAYILRLRLLMQIPFLSKWAQALSVQARPLNASTALKQRAILVDDVWHAAGDQAANLDWYAKRVLLGAVYSATELYMLTDFSAGHRDTWTFLKGRIMDTVNCRKTVLEAYQVAQAVSMSWGKSIESLFNRGCQPLRF